MESSMADVTELVWVPVPRLASSFSLKTGVDGWSTVGAGATTQNQTYFATQPYSRVFLFLRLARTPTVYNLRFVMGSSLLAGMAILTVFINGGEADRLGFANACFLGIVSWQFILVSSTPALGPSRPKRPAPAPKIAERLLPRSFYRAATVSAHTCGPPHAQWVM